jgi:hypothetical protein
VNKQDKTCCNSQEFVTDTQIVVFKVENAVHDATKLIHFNLKWCVNCDQINTLDCVEVIK